MTNSGVHTRRKKWHRLHCAISSPQGRNEMRAAVCAIMLVMAAAPAAWGQSAPTSGGSRMPAAPPDAVKDLAPTGKVRAAINLGNTVLAQRDPAGGEPRGITVDLARELGRRLGL